MDGLTVQRTESPYDAAFATEAWQRNGTRLLVATPTRSGTILDHLDDVHRLVGHCLYDQGAVLFRGFDKGQIAEFRDVAASFGPDLLSYDFGSTPRTRIQEGVYSSTEYPAHQWIPQHNEQAYTLRWPMKIWFYCDIAAPEGGETPVTNSREVYRRIDPAIRRRFAQKQLMYVRHYGDGLDVPWEQVFQTSERADVEAFCRVQQIAWEWLDDGGLRTRQICQSEARHPATGEMVWFNQAHLFHISSLEPDVRESLLAAVDEADLPRNVYYGDGTPIEDSILDDIRGLYRELTVCFRWQEGDILLLDNMLTAHGRAPFKGPRRILVAMARLRIALTVEFLPTTVTSRNLSGGALRSCIVINRVYSTSRTTALLSTTVSNVFDDSRHTTPFVAPWWMSWSSTRISIVGHSDRRICRSLVSRRR